MSTFIKPNIVYTPLDVEVETVVEGSTLSSNLAQTDVDTQITEKLVSHLALIQEYNDRLAAIDYLINNAKTLSGNLTYTTDDSNLISSIAAIGGSYNSVNLALFETAVDIVIQGYKEMSLIALTGVSK